MEFREQEGISFEEAERRHAELKRSYDAGQLGEEEFDAERQRLVVRDDQGRSWAMSRQSGRWLYHDGDSNAWIEGTPPAGSLASSGPSPDGREVALDKSPSQDSPQHHDAVSTPRRDPEEAEASPVSPTTPGEGRSGAPSEDDAGRRRRKAPLLVVLGVAGLVMVLPAVAGLVVYLLWSAQAPALEMPELEGRTLAAARQQVGGDFELVSTEEDSAEPKGTIVSQQPAAGTEVGRGGEISVAVSTGMVTLPDVVGRTRGEAEEALRSGGLEVETRTREGSEEDAGRVVEQSPSGDEAEEGSEVALVVGEASPPPAPPPPPEEASRPAPGYKVIEDPTGALTVEVPSGWEVQTGADSEGELMGVNDWSSIVGYPITSSITIAESLDAWYTPGQPKVGAYIVASRELAEVYTDDELLYSGPFAVPAEKNCEAGSYEEYNRGPYSGKMQTWFCRVNTVYSVAAAPEGRECVILLDLELPSEGTSEADSEAVEHIFDTFEVDCAGIAATSAEQDRSIDLASASRSAPPG